MLEAYGDIWELAGKNGIVVVTTNGFVKKNGEAVMGRGIALEAAQRYPQLPKLLGNHIKEWGNTVGWFDKLDRTIITFPVKPIYGANGEPGWRAKADLELIEQSAKSLASRVSFNILMCFGTSPVVWIPRPGCGNGGLKWEQVKPVIEPILDDRFTVVTWHPDE